MATDQLIADDADRAARSHAMNCATDLTADSCRFVAIADAPLTFDMPYVHWKACIVRGTRLRGSI